MNDVNIYDIHFLEKWSYVGYEMFCDSIIGCGYDSMDEFWECNGI